MKITTKWGEKIDKNNPLPEYPRPQFERDSFINLNGVWSYLISKKKTQINIFIYFLILIPKNELILHDSNNYVCLSHFHYTTRLHVRLPIYNY